MAAIHKHSMDYFRPPGEHEPLTTDNIADDAHAAEHNLSSSPNRPMTAPADHATPSVNACNLAKKEARGHAQAVSNRIDFFRRAEEKIWRDLAEVKRKAQIVEEGRRRALERKVLAQQHAEQKARLLREKKERASETRKMIHGIKDTKKDVIAQRRVMAEKGRQESMDILRAKHLKQQQSKLNNAERALQTQREHLQARMNQQAKKEDRLLSARQMHQDRREQARFEVNDLARSVVALEHEENLCVQRLQHSRVVSQTVLSELEESLGAGSSLAGHFRQRVHQSPDVLRHSPPDDDEGHASMSRPQAKGMPAVGEVDLQPGISNVSNALSSLKFDNEKNDDVNNAPARARDNDLKFDRPEWDASWEPVEQAAPKPKRAIRRGVNNPIKNRSQFTIA